MFAVYKRELRAAFHSMIGWIFMAAMMFFIGLYFSIYNLAQGYPYVAIVFSSIIFVMIIAIPVLTMRVMTEDKKQNTDKLLYTAPVKTISVILGKYFAMLTIFAIPVAIGCLLPLFLGLYGTVPYLESYVGILGFFVYGAACIAIGLFVSSLTENQIVAAVLSFVLLFVGYMMSGITSTLSTSGNILTKILNVYSFRDRISTFYDGVFSLPSFVYFITLTVVFLFFTYEVLQKKRFSLATGRIKRSAFSVGLIAVVVAVAVLGNYALTLLPSNIQQVDVTQEGLYKLSDTTKDFLKNLNEDITVYVTASEDGVDTIVKRLVENYAHESDHIKVVYKDPSLYPEFEAKYSDDSIEGNSLIVESAKRFKVIPNSEMYEMEIDYTTYQQQITGFDGEGRLTSALDYVLNDNLPIVYQICGHGELALSGDLQSRIEKENVQLKSLNLMEVEEIPEDAAGVILLAPTTDFSTDDANKLFAFLEKGGKLLMVTSWVEQGTPNLTSGFEQYGVTLNNGIVVDPSANHYYQNPYILLPEVNSTTLSSEIYNQKRHIIMPYAQGLSVGEEPEDTTVYEILTTSADAYAKTDTSMETWEKEEGDLEGPFALGVLIKKSVDEENETEILWTTTENLLSEQADALVSGSNFELITNMVAEMKGSEDVSSISVPVKSYMAESFTVPRMVFFMGFAVLAILIPLMMVMTGLVIMIGRRKK